MTRTARATVLLLLIGAGSLAALVSGASFLAAPLPGGLPLGNLLATAVLCAPAGIALLLSRPATPLRYYAAAALLAALLWLPVSIVLAGNPALNFSEGSGEAWIWFSLSIVFVVLLAVAWATMDRLFRRR